jgi:hypothetical protein
MQTRPRSSPLPQPQQPTLPCRSSDASSDTPSWDSTTSLKPRRQVPALLLLTVALCMVPATPSYADPPPAASSDFVAIDAYLAQEMGELRIPGLALGIVCTTTR